MMIPNCVHQVMTNQEVRKLDFFIRQGNVYAVIGQQREAYILNLEKNLE